MLRKLLTSFLLAIFLFTSVFVPVAKAQSTWYNQTFQEWYSKVYDTDGSQESEIFGERYTAAQVQWVIYSFWAFLIKSSDNANVVLCFMNQEFNECVDAINDFLSAAPQSTYYAGSPKKESLLAAVFREREFSGISYVKQKLRNLHVIPEAQAQQGFGFGALGPIQQLWRASRDMSYTLFVFVAIIMAFMIMFRVKISPQVVISVQTALPKIIIALILVTFSYAIAGFLVDLLYVIVGILSLMFSVGLGADSTMVFRFLVGENTGIPLPGIFGYLIFYLGLFVIGISAAIYVALEQALNLLAIPVGLFIGFLAFVVLLIVFLFIAFKILWMLFKAVATIYLLVIFGPFQITLGSLGQGGGFGAWLKNIAANLAVFPVTGALFYLAFKFCIEGITQSLLYTWSEAGMCGSINAIRALLESAGFGTPPVDCGPPVASGWSPPLLGLGGYGTPLILVIVSLVTLMLIPKVADIIKSIITQRPFDYGTAIGQAFGPAQTAGLGFLSRESSAQQARYREAQIRQEKLGKPIPEKVQKYQDLWAMGRTVLGKRLQH